MKSGILILILAMALTPFTDGLSKSLTVGQTALFVVFARYFSAGILALGLAAILRHPIEIPHHDRVGQVWRTGLMMGAMVAMVTALSMVELANAVGGFLIAPVVASLIGVALFRERLDSFRLFGSLLSFAGAYIILKPEGSLEFGTLLALLGGVLLGGYLAATRRSSNSSDAFSSLIVQSFLGSALVAPLAFWYGAMHISTSEILVILGLGSVSAVCHFLTIAAYNRTDASILAPFFYFNIVFAIPVGYLWFGELPGSTTLVGLSGIALGGVIAMLSGSRYSTVLKGILGIPGQFAKKYLLKTG